MNNRRIFVFLLLVVSYGILLSGCNTNQSGKEIQSSIASSLTTGSTSSHEEVLATHPWELPTAEPISSAEYFRPGKVYTSEMFVYSPQWLMEDYRLENGSEGFTLFCEDTQIALYCQEEVQKYATNDHFVYFSDEHYIWRSDYGGNIVELLYDAGTDAVIDFYETDDVLFFAVQSEETFAIYRLYVPELQLVLLYDEIPADTADFSLHIPVSPQEISWSYTNSEFLALAEEHFEEYQEKFHIPQEEYTTTYFGMLELDFKQYSGVRCYYNAETGQFATQNFCYVTDSLPVRTEENIAKNGDAWWLDELNG